MGTSSCDLNTESPSRPQSCSSSVFQEDEGVAMESYSWTSNSTPSHTNTNGSSATRFTSWVTFDDDDHTHSHSHSPQTTVPPVAPSPILPRPTQMNLDNLNRRTPLQDSNSNLIYGSGQKNQNRVPERHLLDLTPDGTGTNPAFVLDGPLIHSPKNPFYAEEFSNLQPSSINPFTAFFDQQEGKKPLPSSSTPPLTQAHSNGSGLDSPARLSNSSPFFQSSSDSDLQGDILFFSPPATDHSGNGDGRSAQESPRDDIDTLRNLQIGDPDGCGSPTLPDDSPCLDGENDGDAVDGESTMSYLPSHMTPQDGWPLLLRIPEKKNIMSSRHWGPIFVRLGGEAGSGCLRLFYEKGLEKPFREFQLTTYHELSEAKLQSYDENGRVHTISIDHVLYKEKRKIQPKVSVVHQPFREQLVKLGTKNYEDFLSFRHALQEQLVALSADTGPPNVPPSYADEEVAVEVRDEFYGMVSKGDCRILEHMVLTRVSALVFVSGTPALRVGLNDVLVKGKEVVSRHDILPTTTTRWIRLRDVRLHPCVDWQTFDESRAVSFSPPTGRRFELMRFRTAFAEKTLPFTVRTVASVRGAEVELQSWLVMSTGFSSNRDPLTLIPCENVTVRYPIPELWAKNFRREGVTGEKSLKARFNKGASFGSTSTSGSEPAMRVTLGTAKYEQAFSAVVWRIPRLPDKNSALGHPHTFFCHLELGSDWEVPQQFACQIEVEFDMPATCASKATVRSLSVGDKTDVKKWVTYRSHFAYKVAIEQKGSSNAESPDGDQPSQCAHQ
ncbi:stonin-2 isoform X2 [Engraulis encrasicolus]